MLFLHCWLRDLNCLKAGRGCLGGFDVVSQMLGLIFWDFYIFYIQPIVVSYRIVFFMLLYTHLV